MYVPISVSNNTTKHVFKPTDSSQTSFYTTFKVGGKSLKITVHSNYDNCSLINDKVLEEIARLSLQFGISKKHVKSLHFNGTFTDPVIKKTKIKINERGNAELKEIDINLNHYSIKANKLDSENPDYKQKNEKIFDKEIALNKIGMLWEKLFDSDYMPEEQEDEDEIEVDPGENESQFFEDEVSHDQSSILERHSIQNEEDNFIVI